MTDRGPNDHAREDNVGGDLPTVDPADFVSLLSQSGYLAIAADAETGDLIQINGPAQSFIGERSDQPPHMSDLLTVESLRRLVEEILPMLRLGHSWRGNLEATGSRMVEMSFNGVLAGERLDVVMGLGRDVGAEQQMVAELTRRANEDELTGLANRSPLDARLGQLMADNTPFAIAYFDIDRFKRINDNYGHETGNGVLQAVGSRLERAVRPGDLVARVGGDEFVVVMAGIGDVEAALPITERLVEVISAPGLLADGAEIMLSASAGVAVGIGHGTPTEVIREADAAMYQAKSAARGSVELYSDEARAADARRHLLAQALESAISHRAIRVSYLPVFDLLSHEVVGVEALARWPQPDGSAVSPAEFIPLAAELGLLRDLDDLVMETAMMAIAPITANGKPVPLHVNVSASRLDRYLPERILDILDRFDFKSSRLTLEVTEEALAIDPDNAETITRRLAASGVRIALDDFGTGYSSLSHLTRFGLHSLKIDRAFVGGIGTENNSGPIIDAVLNLAASLGLEVVAEGIETAAQRHILLEAGCTQGQGFLMSRPLLIEELTEFMAPVSEPALLNPGAPTGHRAPSEHHA